MVLACLSVFFAFRSKKVYVAYLFYPLQWVVLVLYGIAGALFSYCVSLMVASPLAAFATVAGYQFIMFIVRFPSTSVFHDLYSNIYSFTPLHIFSF